jgi:hypothetical protein
MANRNIMLTKQRARKPLYSAHNFSVGYRNMDNGPCTSLTLMQPEGPSYTLLLPGEVVDLLHKQSVYHGLSSGNLDACKSALRQARTLLHNLGEFSIAERLAVVEDIDAALGESS